MEKKEKILIIKTGYTEILDKKQHSRIISYGDVLRTTPLLHKFKHKHLTWTCSEEALPLLMDNSYIDRLLIFDNINIHQLLSEEFDKVINLEKVPGICAISDKIRARRSRYGFTFNSQTGEAEALDKAYKVLAVSFDPESKKGNEKSYQELLFEMVGEKFNGEKYILGYRPETKEIYDIGFNVYVGKKWPSKSWPIENWNKLESILKKEDLRITRQDKQPKNILEDLYSYIDWINSSKTLITNDSLGLHIALALNKKILGLFGPTSSKEIYFYNRGKAILPEENTRDYGCLPCFNPQCKRYDKSCMSDISPEKIATEIKDFLS